MPRRRFSLLLSLLPTACGFPSYSFLDHTVPVCAENPCQNGGVCVVAEAQNLCYCSPGFRGDHCDLLEATCAADRCLNGGVCVEDGGDIRCDCATGWEGDSCQINHDDCTPNPCANGGSCADGIGSFTCSCSNGFTGASCSEPIAATCAEILTRNSGAPSGTYLVDPDGIDVGQPPFETVCDMIEDGGGWTLVGRELPGQTGTFKFLSLNVGDSTGASLGESSDLVGVRFFGLYRQVRLNWSGTSTGFIRFSIAEDLFANTTSAAIPVTDFSTSDGELASWVAADGGAIFCRGSSYSQVRPGDTSWAVKPRSDAHTMCGCNDSNWLGRGAFYGGHSDATSCNPGGGGWAGVRNSGEQKGGVSGYGLDVWIR